MPILNIDKEYAITITYKCNWNCVYCAVKNKYDYKENVTEEDVLKKIEKIPNFSNVTIFGGEPGIVERQQIEKYISELENKNCTLYLETNGLFLKKYPDLCNKFK